MDGGAEDGGRGSTSGGDAEGGGSSQEDENAIERRIRQNARGDQDVAKKVDWEGGMSTTTLVGPSPARVNHFSPSQKGAKECV